MDNTVVDTTVVDNTMVDTTVIQEIANQLGMAVDATAQFISDITPQYAMLKIVENSIWLGVSLFFVVAGIVLGVLVIKRSKKKLEKAKKGEFEDSELNSWDDFDHLCVVVAVCGAGAMALFIIVNFLVAPFAAEVAGWAVAPDAKMLEMALNAID